MLSSASAQSWDEIVTAANKEGKVTFMHNIPGKAGEHIAEAFNKDYPNIQVEQIRLSSGAIGGRFETEFNAGRHLWDVVNTNIDDKVRKGLDSGWALKWTPPEAANYDADYSINNTAFAEFISRDILIWNNSLVSDADAPKDWADLLDPKFKGKIGISPPWRSVSPLTWVFYIENVLGIKDFAERLKANDLQFFEGTGAIQQALLRGDIQVAATADTLNDLLSDGAPIGFVYPASGVIATANRAFIAKEAPHPNAGKVFLNWLLSEKGQKILIGDGIISPRNGMPGPSQLPANSEIPKLLSADSLSISDEAKQDIIDRWRHVFNVQ